jgi:hypothetical protein
MRIASGIGNHRTQRSNSGARFVVICTLALVLVALAMPAVAQEDKDKDNSGTNPINFTWDWRSYVEMVKLEGDNSSITNTIEMRVPLGEKWTVRTRVRRSSLSLDPDGDGLSTEVSGIGDMDARVLYVPYQTQKRALVFGLEGFFDTASNRFLGSGRTAIGPQIFGVFFNPIGGGTLMAPAVQQIIDVDGDEDRDEVSKTQFDFFYLVLDKSKKWWILGNPQYVIDHEQDTEFGLFEVEYGRMILGGFSMYTRLSAAFGADTPYDYSTELGFKAVWR